MDGLNCSRRPPRADLLCSLSKVRPIKIPNWLRELFVVSVKWQGESGGNSELWLSVVFWKELVRIKRTWKLLECHGFCFLVFVFFFLSSLLWAQTDIRFLMLGTMYRQQRACSSVKMYRHRTPPPCQHELLHADRYSFCYTDYDCVTTAWEWGRVFCFCCG